MTQISCHCQSKKSFSTCCQPLLSRRRKPNTPEELMRSRYTAYCRGDTTYLSESTHPSQRTPNDRKLFQHTIDNTAWLGLRILDAPKPFVDAHTHTKGVVEFVVFFTVQMPELVIPKKFAPDQLHERSEFILENGQWYYVTGLQLDPIKIARNDLCWCGSEKKSKKCHGT